MNEQFAHPPKYNPVCSASSAGVGEYKCPGYDNKLFDAHKSYIYIYIFSVSQK